MAKHEGFTVLAVQRVLDTDFEEADVIYFPDAKTPRDAALAVLHQRGEMWCVAAAVAGDQPVLLPKAAGYDDVRGLMKCENCSALYSESDDSGICQDCSDQQRAADILDCADDARST